MSISEVRFAQGLEVQHVECGGQFSAVVCRNGAVYTWGKGDHCRLGHDTEEHVR